MDTIDVACPQCGKHYHLPKPWSKRVHCRNCGAVMEPVEPGSTPPREPDETAPETAHEPAKGWVLQLECSQCGGVQMVFAGSASGGVACRRCGSKLFP